MASNGWPSTGGSVAIEEEIRRRKTPFWSQFNQEPRIIPGCPAPMAQWTPTTVTLVQHKDKFAAESSPCFCVTYYLMHCVSCHAAACVSTCHDALLECSSSIFACFRPFKPDAHSHQCMHAVTWCNALSYLSVYQYWDASLWCWSQSKSPDRHFCKCRLHAGCRFADKTQPRRRQWMKQHMFHAADNRV